MSLPIRPPTPDALSVTRRHFFGRTASGIGTAALATLLAEEAKPAVPARSKPSLPAHASGGMGTTHFPPKAKRVIYLFMSGAPSQIDLLDPKPKMEAFYDKDLPESVRKGQRLTTMTSKQKRFPIAPSIYKFHKRGQAGTEISELLPHVGTIADEMALVRTIHTEAINHDPAITYIQTAAQQPGRPSMGAAGGRRAADAVRPRPRQPESPWGCGPAFHLERQARRPGTVHTSLGCRIPPITPSRGGPSFEWRPGAVPLQPGRCQFHHTSKNARFTCTTQPAAIPGGGGPGNRGEDCPVRNGLPHANIGPRIDRLVR